jgi:hypothetical protein
MATKVERFPYENYPWEEWFDGDTWQLSKCIDHTKVPVETMVEYAKKAAAKMNVKLEIELLTPVGGGTGDRQIRLRGTPNSSKTSKALPNRVAAYLHGKGGKLGWTDAYRGLHVSAAGFAAAVEKLLAEGSVVTDAEVKDGKIVKRGTYVALI